MALINQDYYKEARARMDSIYNAYKAGKEKTRAEELAKLNENRDNELAKSKAQYDVSGRQNYINYMQARKQAPSQLNAMGIRGGASESSLIRLGTNYNSNVASNNLARNNAADEITNNYSQQTFDLNKAYDDDLATRYAELLEKADAEAKAEEQRQLSYFAQAIQGQYKTKKGYEKLIKQLQASNDPQKVAKIMLARQAMNALKGGGGSGGGGGGGRSYGGGGYSSSSSSSSGSSKTNAQKLNDKYKNRSTPSGKSGSTSKSKKSIWRKYGVPKSIGRWVG